MNPLQYLNRIEELNIRSYGFDTHARVLGIEKEEVKALWNEATGWEFKRAPRTEYSFTRLPEYSTDSKPFWRLNAPDGYLIFHLTPISFIIVPDGFYTDKGSIPKIFRNIIQHDDREMILAYLIHDLECEMNRMTRFSVDGLLYEIGTEMGASWLKKNAVYTAVRMASFRKTKDVIVNDFNISGYNRDIIAQAEEDYIKSDRMKSVTSIFI